MLAIVEYETSLMTFGEWIRSVMEDKGLTVMVCCTRAVDENGKPMQHSQWNAIMEDEPKTASGGLPLRSRKVVKRVALALDVPIREAEAVAYAGATASYEDPIRKAIGERIVARRHSLGLRQEDVAQQLGMSRTGYTNWERGRVEIPASQLSRLAQILQVPTAYFFGENVSTEQTDVLSRMYQALTPADRQTLRILAERLASRGPLPDEDEEIGR